MAKTIGSFDLASLKNLRDDVTQYFWFESDSSSAWGSGAHVTLYPESQFTNPSHANYMKGQNIIMNTDGFSIRNGGLPMMVLDNDSLDFNAVDTSLGTYTKMATFGLSGMQIYSRDSNNNLVQLANIGYGPGIDSGGGTSDAPYYTLGTRASGSAIGNYSHAEGYNTIASAYCAHAEGGTRSVIVSPETIASGEYSHAEGGSTTASAGCSHAEGYGTIASGPHSHAEGFYTTAEGTNSHAGGCGTTVIKHSQTAIGEYNEIDNYADTNGKYAFIIGNGTSDNARSNALTVDWDGNVEAAGALFANGAEFSKQASNHIVIGGYHVCWGVETITHSGGGYLETETTLPYTYTSAPRCFASYGNRPLGGAARTAYATYNSQAGNKIYVGSYATGSVTAYVNWMTIGV